MGYAGRQRILNPVFLPTMLFLCLLPAFGYGRWALLGPNGGDVRSLAADPNHPERIFLGTSGGQMFVSGDNGVTWTRLAHLGGSDDDYVLDNIRIDSQTGTIYVGAWRSSSAKPGGDLFRSRDGGRTWRPIAGMHGKSIRALALALSDPKILVVGALDGVYRSGNGGDTWQHISPDGNDQFRNVESVAIDPDDPNLIYVGTWHLGWKTTDGGGTWRPIKNGVDDDSDVFSIVIDYSNTNNIYLSACSGIYKSEYAAEFFRRVQGVPYSARRTRVLKQDPTSPAVIYAGTTDGLWKTDNAGKRWRGLLPNVTVNDIHIDPRDPRRILLATDRSGVLLSTDGGATFEPSNRGFSHRAVSAILVDVSDSQTIYAGVLNDKEFGGIFVSRDRGQNWRQLNNGLENLDIFTLAQTEKGDIVAGTNSGMFTLARDASEWRPSDFVYQQIVDTGRIHATPSVPQILSIPRWTKLRLRTRVSQVQITPTKWLAATATGIYHSQDEGRSWEGGPILEYQDFRSVQVYKSTVLATTCKTAVLSTDGGWTWTALRLPSYVTTVYAGALESDNILWLATHEGPLRSTDSGGSWESMASGRLYDVTTIVYDIEERRLFALARGGQLITSTDSGQSWQIQETGFPLRMITLMRGQVLAATAFDGIIAQPQAAPGDAQVAAAQK
jgi:photosystem II stability/assembly factor-like uncharacterized protein